MILTHSSSKKNVMKKDETKLHKIPEKIEEHVSVT